MAGNSNNITIKLKVDGSEDAVRVVNKVKSSFDEVIKAQADLVKQKAKEIELDGALKRSLDARAKILKEDMQKARIEEFKSMQEVLRTERIIGSEIKKRAGEIANAKRQANAEVAAKRENLKLTKDILRADKDRTLGNLAILKQEANLRAANHRAEINRIKAEKAARIEAQAASGGGRGDRSTFFAPVIQTIASRVGLSDAAARNASGMLDFLGRANLALLVIKKSLDSLSDITKQLIDSSIAAEKFNLKIKSLEVVTRNASLSFGQARSIFQDFNDGLQSQDAILTATRTFATLGISASQTRDLISGLRDGIVAMGGDVSEQLPLMALAFKRQESALLDNAGITANLDVMYKEYAKTLGTSVDKLTTQQKVQASVVGSLKELRMYQGLASEQSKGLTGANAKMNLTYETMSRNLAEGNRFLADLAIAGQSALNLVLLPLSGAWKAVGQAIGAATGPIRDATLALVGLMEKLDPSKFKYGYYNREASIASMTADTSMTARRFAEAGVKPAAVALSGDDLDKAIGAGYLKEIQDKRQQSLDQFADSLTRQGKKLKSGAIVARGNLLEFAQEDVATRKRVLSIYRGSESEFSDKLRKMQTGQPIGPERSIFRLDDEDIKKAKENYSVLSQDLIELNNRFSQADFTASREAEEKKAKNRKEAFEKTLRFSFETLQSQKSIEMSLFVGSEITRQIRNAGSDIIDQNQRRVLLADAENKIREKLLSVANKSTKAEYDGIRLATLKAKISGEQLDEEKIIDQELVLLKKDREAIESRISGLRSKGLNDIADELESSSGYVGILERIVKLIQDKNNLQDDALRKAKQESEERVKLFKSEQSNRLDKMVKAHKVRLVDDPEGEVDAYRMLIKKLEDERTKLEIDAYKKPVITEEDQKKYEIIQDVIDEATQKMDESIKDSFNKTVDIVQSGLEKTYSVIQASISGDFGSAFSVITGDILSDITKQISNKLSLDESFRKAVSGSKEALGNALSPIIDKISSDIAKPIVDGINAGLSNPAISNAIVGLGVTAVGAVGGLMIMWELLGKKIFNYFEEVKNFAIETQNATKISISAFGREFKSKRGEVYGLRSGGIGSADLEENLKKQEEERKKMDKAGQEIRKNNSSIQDFIMSGMGIGTVQSGVDYLAASQKLAELEKQYRETQDAADKYNDQLNREEALKSSKEMLYDLDQQIAEMNIDNALKMGQITQEEADRQKKLLEIEQKKKELTDQAVDIASGFVDQSVLRKYKDNPQQFQADLSAAVNDFAKTGNTKGLEALGITGEEIKGPGGLQKIFERIGQILAGDKASANMPGSSPDKPMYTQVVNVKDFRLAFPDSAYFRAPSVATTSGGVTTLNGNSTTVR